MPKLKLGHRVAFVAAGGAIAAISIEEPQHLTLIQALTLTAMVLGISIAILWGERRRPKFLQALLVLGAVHGIGLASFWNLFPLRNEWYLGGLALAEVFVLVLIAYKVMGLYQDE